MSLNSERIGLGLKPIIGVYNLRSCEVNGNKGYFHGWYEKKDYLLQYKAMATKNNMKRMHDCFKELNAIDNSCDIYELNKLVGIVEFEDGHIEEIVPEDIRFLDKPIVRRTYNEL